MKRHLIFAVIFSLFVSVGVVSAQGDVDLDLGDIPAGQQVTITYDVTVNDELPAGLLFISNQGVVTADNLPTTILSDDPQTAVSGDTTNTPVGFTLSEVIQELPATGQTPFWMVMLISLSAAALVTGMAGFVWQRRSMA